MVPSVAPVPSVPEPTPDVPEPVPDVPVRAPTDRRVVNVSSIPERMLSPTPDPGGGGRVGVLWMPDVLVLGVGSTQPVLLPGTVEGGTGGTAGGTAGAGTAGLTPAGPKSLPGGLLVVFEFKTAGGIGAIGPSPKGPQ
jgi:hypothetical protein